MLKRIGFSKIYYLIWKIQPCTVLYRSQSAWLKVCIGKRQHQLQAVLDLPSLIQRLFQVTRMLNKGIYNLCLKLQPFYAIKMHLLQGSEFCPHPPLLLSSIYGVWLSTTPALHPPNWLFSPLSARLYSIGFALWKRIKSTKQFLHARLHTKKC